MVPAHVVWSYRKAQSVVNHLAEGFNDPATLANQRREVGDREPGAMVRKSADWLRALGSAVQRSLLVTAAGRVAARELVQAGISGFLAGRRGRHVNVHGLRAKRC